MVEEAQCDCDDLAKAPSKPPPVLIARLRKWSLPTCVLGDELGRGSTGVVLRASLGDCETVVPVAVKVLREATSGCAMGQVKQRAERLPRVWRTPACATSCHAPGHTTPPGAPTPTRACRRLSSSLRTRRPGYEQLGARSPSKLFTVCAKLSRWCCHSNATHECHELTQSRRDAWREMQNCLRTTEPSSGFLVVVCATSVKPTSSGYEIARLLRFNASS